MVHPNPEMRPTATCLIQNRLFCTKTKAQSRREPNAEKQKNEEIKTSTSKVATTTVEGNSGGYRLRPTPTRLSSRAIGKKVNRSQSTTNF